MLPDNPEHLKSELDRAIAKRDKHLAAVSRKIRRIVGRCYSADTMDDEAQPENVDYAYIATMLPQLVHDNPQFNIKAQQAVGHAAVREAMELGINTWTIAVNLELTISRIVLDMILCWGAGITMLERDKRWAMGAVRPLVKRVAPSRIFLDPTADHWTESSYIGHEFVVQYKRLAADPSIDQEALEEIKDYCVADSAIRKGEAFKKDYSGTPDNPYLQLCTVWDREENIVRLISRQHQALDLRPPNKYWGDPERGPYTLFGAMNVTGEPYPLSPLIAAEDQINNLNIHALAMGRAAAARKKIVIIDSNQPDLARAVVQTKDGHVRMVRNFNNNGMQEIEFGGVTNDQYTYHGNQQTRTDNTLGISDATRGTASGRATATENNIAADASSLRVELISKCTSSAVVNVVMSVGWLMFYTPGIVIPVTPDDITTMIDDDGFFMGGQDPADNGAEWSDFNITIRPYSMQRTNEALMQRRFFDFSDRLIDFAGLIPQMPFVRWKKLIGDMAAVMNIPGGEKYIDWQMLSSMAVIGPDAMPLLPASAMLGPDTQGGVQAGASPAYGEIEPRGRSQGMARGRGRPAGGQPALTSQSPRDIGGPMGKARETGELARQSTRGGY